MSLDQDIIDLLYAVDVALASNNPAVKKALKNLLTIATLTRDAYNTENDSSSRLRQFLEEFEDIRKRLILIESELNSLKNNVDVNKKYTNGYWWDVGTTSTTTSAARSVSSNIPFTVSNDRYEIGKIFIDDKDE